MDERGPMGEAWSWAVADYGNTVTVYERTPGGTIYVRMPHPGMKSRYVRRSLKHSDREKAKRYAKEQAAKLARGAARIRDGKLTLGELFALYRRFRLPDKGRLRRKADARRIAMFARVLGKGREAGKLSLREWNDFARKRRSGAIDAKGRPVPEGERTEVRASTVNADLRLLAAVLAWAAAWQDPVTERRLLTDNPARDYPYLKARRPRRPVASADRYEATMAVAHEVTTYWLHDGRRRRGPTYLPELLPVLAYTGRRLYAVLQLRHGDLLLDPTRAAPHGAVRWPAETDKDDEEHTVPLHPEARAAIDRQRERFPGVGRACLWPSCGDRSVPLARATAATWLKKAEKLAGLPKLDGGLFHPYRRKWATERKVHPVKDVMGAGGWKSLQVFSESYLHDDPDTTLRVVLEAGELREIREG